MVASPASMPTPVDRSQAFSQILTAWMDVQFRSPCSKAGDSVPGHRLRR